MAWGATVAAAPLGASGGGVKRSRGARPPVRAIILGCKLLIDSDCCRLWGRQWLGVMLWTLNSLVTLVEGQIVLEEKYPYDLFQPKTDLFSTRALI